VRGVPRTADGRIQQRACTQTIFPASYHHERARLCRSRQAVATRCEKGFLIISDIWAVTTGTGGFPDVVKTNVFFTNGVSSPEYVTLQLSRTTTNCIQKTSFVWQWRMENTNGTGSSAYDLNTSGVHTVYIILDIPVAPESEPRVDLLDYACVWAGQTDTKTSACVAILSNGFSAHYTWNYDCHRLSSDFVRLVSSLGIAASQTLWASIGTMTSGNIGDMCNQRTKSFTPVGGTNGVREWSWHQWAQAEGCQRDPSASVTLSGAWGDYEDNLFTHYYTCTSSLPFGAVWLTNNVGQSSGCEVHPTHCTYNPNPTLYLWRGPDR